MIVLRKRVLPHLQFLCNSNASNGVHIHWNLIHITPEYAFGKATQLALLLLELISFEDASGINAIFVTKIVSQIRFRASDRGITFVRMKIDHNFVFER